MGASVAKVWTNSHHFNHNTKASEVAEKFEEQAQGKTIVITGTTNGIGKHTALALGLLHKPPTLVFANRNKEASQALIDEIHSKRPETTIHHVNLDLSSLQSVKECAQEILALNLPVNVLILNAGIFVSEFGITKEGYERTFGVNHLGHFYLTKLLLPKLQESAADDHWSRIVVVASKSHYDGKIDFSDFPLSKETFSDGGIVTQKAYAQSKLCNVLFANHLNEKFQAENIPITANSLHPASMTKSNIGNESTITRIAMHIASLFTRSLDEAASTSTMLALSPELEKKGGMYFDECDAVVPSKDAEDKELAKKLWDFSEELISKFESSQQN